MERAKRFEAYLGHFDASDASGQHPSKACFCPLQRSHCKCVTEMDNVHVQTAAEHLQTILTEQKSTTITEPEQNLEAKAGGEGDGRRPLEMVDASKERNDDTLVRFLDLWEGLSVPYRIKIIELAQRLAKSMSPAIIDSE